ncbi:glycoside hydrolase family 43 protein [Vararia minispora EC-137]|uniref:Glycoside hydrolase family 43 protein n=1 Tax=Vararia minispora EC-137 TaxID=1314806 RepID=A0ACB8QEV7_9AGAM|nr:glycoside hydrolase family 43 protein [Vararia minispora EC-137]
MLSLLPLLAAALPLVLASTLSRRSINGPVITSNFPDPSILAVGGIYYVYSTNSGGKHVPMQTSSDFVNWVPVSTDALPTVGAWSNGQNVWAPDVVQLRDGSYVMYYAAESATSPNRHCVGAATASNPQGPFAPVSTALVCNTDQGGAIDPAGFSDVDGSLYLLWKIDGNNIGHGGNCGNSVAPIVPTPIMMQKLDASGTAFAAGSSAIQVLDRDNNDGPLIEAPSLVRTSGGVYVLFFSSNCYAGSLYDIAYATATSVTGPYTKGPWLMKTGTPFANLYSPGGADVTPDGTRLVFHADLGTTANTRQMYTASISISGHTVSI